MGTTYDRCLRELREELWRFWKLISAEDATVVSHRNVCEKRKSLYGDFSWYIEMSRSRGNEGEPSSRGGGLRGGCEASGRASRRNRRGPDGGIPQERLRETQVALRGLLEVDRDEQEQRGNPRAEEEVFAPVARRPGGTDGVEVEVHSFDVLLESPRLASPRLAPNAMNRDDMHFRDRLLLLAECSNPHKPFNVKRKPPLTKQGPSRGGPKLSVQDFVRMDPGYTPDIEHLVFPAKKRSPQQVAPAASGPPSQPTPSKSRSRLVEMFALSRHLHQRSVERETKSRAGLFNRSVDSAVPQRQRQKAPPSGPPRAPPPPFAASRRWTSEAEEAEGKRQQQAVSACQAADEASRDPTRGLMTSTRGPNVSILHLRSTSEPWEAAPSTTYPMATRGHAPGRAPRLTKHQSLGAAPAPPPPRACAAAAPRWSVDPPEMFVDRELSPVRWYDREVDGVYLGRSGWVQVQQRSLDEKRRSNYIGSKLANFHAAPGRGVMKGYRFNSEPERPARLSLRDADDVVVFDDCSPPPATPIISPPPAFQDEKTKRCAAAAAQPTTRSFFGKAPFLPRSNAIEDSDASPPATPRRCRVPQARSLEDATAARRGRFAQHYRASSSSSSSSMGFRSLDGALNRASGGGGVAMPRLSENTDSSSVDYRHQDADDEDNYSSSVNVRVAPPAQKASPSGRVNRQLAHRSSSSSSSSAEASPRRYQDEAAQRVRRSRSLQLPEKQTQAPAQRTSPQQQPARIETIPERPRRLRGKAQTEEGLLREAEIVTGYLYGSRSRAAAQALLNHRLLNSQSSKEEGGGGGGGVGSPPDAIAVYYVSGGGGEPRRQQRAAPQMRPSQSYPKPKQSGGRPPKARRGQRAASGGGNGGGSSGSSRGGGGSTPVGAEARPGSAPTGEATPRHPQHQRQGESLQAQQRSMSLPKSFLSTSYQPCGTILWQRHGTERVASSPGLPRKTPSPETSHTAPVTPLHEGHRRRSPVDVPSPARSKAASTPQLLDEQRPETSRWPEEVERVEAAVAPAEKEAESHGNTAAVTSTRDRETGGAEGVLQKFKKSLSLRFQASSGRRGGQEAEEARDEEAAGAGEDAQRQRQAHAQAPAEQKHKFGSMIWRSGKEKKRLSKSIRSAKCNSGDSGIQLEMAPGCGGFGDSSESHDTDALGDELDSPPLVRRRRRGPGDDGGAEPEVVRRQAPRPHSELVGQVLIDEFKADLECRPGCADEERRRAADQPVRRTRSDLGARARRPRRPEAARAPGAASPRAHPAQGGVATTLRRSLSQPVDIDRIVAEGADAMRVASNAASSSEDEARTTSNSESSLASLPERRRSSPSGGGGGALLAEAVFDHVAIDGEELAFRAGDVVRVLDAAHDEWWWGTAAQGARRSAPGWFPSNSVRVRAACPPDGRSRGCVVRELLQTERDFVAGLVDVVDGYLGECSRRPDMFDAATVRQVFGNVAELLEFQRRFLADLEARVDADAPHKSRLGGCFLRHRDGFRMYSEYCNSHPVSTAALQELYRKDGYREFFEACRLMRGLMEIPLDGYLLTPVQRICKYPLQLAELLKYTRRDHPDYADVKEALEAMRGVAVLINERKRRMECLEKLARWQERVDGWEGEDLIEASSQLIHQGEVVKVTTGMWTNNITLFLFDHQILYCKKDLLKRNSYVYKGRIPLDNCEVVDLPDGKDLFLGASIRHAIKLADRDSDRFLLFCCRSAKDKQRWLRAFDEERKASEAQDPELELPPSARRLAKLAARRKRRPPTKLKDARPAKAEYATDSLGRRVGRMGNWFGFRRARHPQDPPHEAS